MDNKLQWYIAQTERQYKENLATENTRRTDIEYN
jgi:hypothetical protein